MLTVKATESSVPPSKVIKVLAVIAKLMKMNAAITHDKT